MSSTNKIILGLVLAVAVIGGGFYLYVSRPVAAPSTQINQLPPAGDQADAETPSASNSFQIVQEGSEVSFTLDELLRGEPTVVVGTTNQVAGEFTFDPANASAASLGTIRVNARTLQTDSPQRNGAISRFILESEKPENEFITFEPTRIQGLPSQVAVGDSFNVSITGDLKIRNTVKEVTFTGSAKLDAADRLTTDVSTDVRRGDYGLVIPNIPFVANVEETVTLRAKLVATKSAATTDEHVNMDHGDDLVEDTKGGDTGAVVPTVDAQGVQEITVTGSSFRFSPSNFTVKKGQKVRLTFKNSGGRHDFVIDELGVSTRLLQTGEDQVVEFTPDKTGSFEYYCSVGNHRAMGMVGTIIVQ